MNRPMAEAQQTKQKIFYAAVNILKKTGYENLTIRKICEEAGISNGGFYHHFKSKDELLSYYYTEAFETYLMELEEGLKGKPLRERILSYYVWFLQYTCRFGIEFCTAFYTPRNRAIDTNATYNAVFERSREILQDAQQDILAGQTVDEIAEELCILFKGVVLDWCSHNGDYDLVEVGTRLFKKYLTATTKEDTKSFTDSPE